jgi:hypothetical protein
VILGSYCKNPTFEVVSSAFWRMLSLETVVEAYLAHAAERCGSWRPCGIDTASVSADDDVVVEALTSVCI